MNKGSTIGIRVHENIKQDFNDYCKELGMTESDVLRQFIDRCQARFNSNVLMEDFKPSGDLENDFIKLKRIGVLDEPTTKLISKMVKKLDIIGDTKKWCGDHLKNYGLNICDDGNCVLCKSKTSITDQYEIQLSNKYKSIILDTEKRNVDTVRDMEKRHSETIRNMETRYANNTEDIFKKGVQYACSLYKENAFLTESNVMFRLALDKIFPKKQ